MTWSKGPAFGVIQKSSAGVLRLNVFKLFVAVVFFEALIITLLTMRKKDYDDCVKRRGEAYAKDRKKIIMVLGPSLIAFTGLAWLIATFWG